MSLNSKNILDAKLDLNSIFNLNYNFDMLKTIIEGLIQNQKRMNTKLSTLEQKLNSSKRGMLSKKKQIEKDEEDEEEKSDEKKDNSEDKSEENDSEDKDDSNSGPMYKLKDNEMIVEMDFKTSVEKRLDELEKKFEGANVTDFVKANINSSESNDDPNLNNIAINLVSKLEAKMNKKFTAFEESQKNMTGDINNIKENIEKHILPDEDEKKKPVTNEVLDGKLEEINNNFELLIKKCNDNKDAIENKDSMFRDTMNTLQQRCKDATTQVRVIQDKTKDFLKSDDLKLLENEMNHLFELENDLIKHNNSFLKQKIASLEEKYALLDGNALMDDIQFCKSRIETLMASDQKINNLEKKINDEINKHRFEPNKYLEVREFNDYKATVNNRFNQAGASTLKINETIEGQILPLLGKKAFLRDLKTLEDSLMQKIEDVRSSLGKKFVDKAEFNKNIKYLDTQIKLCTDSLNKRADKGDNWLLAKRPLNAHLCASCEAYLGELKESPQFVPWNKYPTKDPNDKLYRIGTGFSKMLQMVSIENNNVGGANMQSMQMQNMPNNIVMNNNMFVAGPGMDIKKSEDAGYSSVSYAIAAGGNNLSNLNGGVVDDGMIGMMGDGYVGMGVGDGGMRPSASSGNMLPQIRTKTKKERGESNINNMEIGKDEVLEDPMESRKIENDKENPKIMKIVKKNNK